MKYQSWSSWRDLVWDNDRLNVHYPLINDFVYTIYEHKEIQIAVTDLDIVFQ